MNYPLPIKSLHRNNLLMATFINVFAAVILIVSKAFSLLFIATIFLESFATFYLLGLCNIITLKFVSEKYTNHKRPVFFRHLLGTFLSFTVFVLSVIIFSYLKNEDVGLADKAKIIVRILVYAVFQILTILIQNQVLLQNNHALLQQSKSKAELENSQLKAAIIEASNFLLRQQIHPHFLFNSLTILKSLYKKDVVKGEFYLTRLANFLRASISDHSSKITSLQTELSLCLDYMEMQKIRFGNALEYNVSVSESVKAKFVPFFSVQVLLENAIKHNVLTLSTPLKITVSEINNSIRVTNNLQLKSNKEVSTGQGLSNLAERYRLLSGDSILITQNDQSFIVTIKIYENDNCNY